MSSKEGGVMDVLARAWEWLRCMLHDRPIQLTMYGIGILLLSIALTYSIVKSNENENNITEIRQALCNSPEERRPRDRTKDCQKLFDRLLAHPTPEQAERLKTIIKNGE